MTHAELKALKAAEWNTLFPVELVAYDPTWSTLFAQEKKRLLTAIGAERLIAIQHFGSTAIVGIQAKPYIDMLIAIAPEHLFSDDLIQQFEALGYVYFKVPERERIAAYMSFGKGYQRSSKRTQIYHLHVCPMSNVMWEQLAFRDYLNTHPMRARQYERLKLGLAAQFKHDRGAYVLGKTRFIADTLALARQPTGGQTFPVITSTLDAVALGQLVAQRYGYNSAAACRLLKTGMNHTYLVTQGDEQAVLRVYTYNWRTRAEIEAELALLTSLHTQGLAVSYPLPDESGAFIQEVFAPEGTRYVVLFSFAHGGKVRFLTPTACAAVGSMMGRLHQLTAGQKLARPIYTPEVLITQAVATAQTYFANELPEMHYVHQLSTQLVTAFTQAGVAAAPTGAVHLDIWYDNMAIDSQDKVTLFDFDFCGNGPAILDVGYFCLQLFNIEADKQLYEEKVAHFLAGYTQGRDLSAAERRLLPAAGAAVWLFYLGTQVSRFDWSNFFLSPNYLKAYIGMLQSWLAYHQWPTIEQAVTNADGPAA